MRKAWLGVLSLGVVGWLAAACSGSDFSGVTEPSSTAGADSSAGAPPDSNGGAPDSSGGSSSVAGKGGTGGEAGAGGMPSLPPDCQPDDPPMCASKLSVAACDASGTWQLSECAAGPQDCAPATCSKGACVTNTLVPVDVAGDCKHWSCFNGQTTNEVDLKDLPASRGACDVPSCTEAGPMFHGDDSKCASNKQCAEGKCVCRACPNGKLPNVVADSCLMPQGVVATANKTLMGSTPAGAIDGTTTKTWNSGALDGTLTLTLAAPQAMTALVVYVTGQDGNGTMLAKTITVTAIVEVGDAGAPISKIGTWDFSSTPTGPVRLELGLLKATKITLKFSSPSSWIAVNEVFMVVCS